MSVTNTGTDLHCKNVYAVSGKFWQNNRLAPPVGKSWIAAIADLQFRFQTQTSLSGGSMISQRVAPTPEGEGANLLFAIIFCRKLRENWTEIRHWPLYTISFSMTRRKMHRCVCSLLNWLFSTLKISGPSTTTTTLSPVTTNLHLRPADPEQPPRFCAQSKSLCIRQILLHLFLRIT